MAQPLATDMVVWKDPKGNTHDVQRQVRALLQQPYRGAKLTAADRRVLRFWNEEPLLVGADVKTKFILKADPSVCKVMKRREDNKINTTKLHPYIASCRAISDDDKRALFQHFRSHTALEWKKNHEPVRVANTAPAQRLVRIEEAAKTDAEKEIDAHQASLKDFGFQSINDTQIKALQFFMATFFICCVVPFNVSGHWAFLGMVGALAPAFKDKIPSRWSLSRTWLPDVYKKCKARTDDALKKTRRMKTAVIDGFKDRKSRHVMNMSWGCRGAMFYRNTAWFGPRSKTGQTHWTTLEEELGSDLEDTQAIIADNTSSMSSPINGLFGLVIAAYARIYCIGCVVHVYDLLLENLVNVQEIAEITGNALFISYFVLRFGSVS